MSTRIIIKQNDKILLLSVDDIIYCSAFQGYTNLTIENGSSIIVAKTLSQFSSDLDQNFIQISQSYIINSKYLKALEKTKRCVLLAFRCPIPIK